MRSVSKELIDSHWYYGGIASAGACCFTHPFDLIRTQIQSNLLPLTTKQVVRLIIKNEGFRGLYYGVSVSVQRQLTYALSRFGLYHLAREYGLTDTFTKKVIMSSASGFISGFLSTPIERVSLLMRTDVIKPMELRRNYISSEDGLLRLYNDGGLRNLYRGAWPSSLRGMLMTGGQLSVYDQLKEMLIGSDKDFGDNWKTYFIASIFAGGIASIISMPMEVIKNIEMNADVGTFHGSYDVFRSLYRMYGYKGFFKGFMPCMCRVVPQTVLTFIIYEELLKRYCY